MATLQKFLSNHYIGKIWWCQIQIILLPKNRQVFRQHLFFSIYFCRIFENERVRWIHIVQNIDKNAFSSILTKFSVKIVPNQTLFLIRLQIHWYIVSRGQIKFMNRFFAQIRHPQNPTIVCISPKFLPPVCKLLKKLQCKSLNSEINASKLEIWQKFRKYGKNKWILRRSDLSKESFHKLYRIRNLCWKGNFDSWEKSSNLLQLECCR